MKKMSLLLLLFLPFCILANETRIDSVSSNFISVVEIDKENSTTIGIYGDGFSDLIFNENINLYLGDFLGQNISGNDNAVNATFYFSNKSLTKNSQDLSFKFINSDTQEIIYSSNLSVTFFNPYAANYTKPKLKKFFKKAKNKKATKKRVGLNVHQATAASNNEDDEYFNKLKNSNTKWVREHFSHKLIMGASKTSWTTRYDKVMRQYKDNNIRVVGMLAYDKNQDYSDVSIGAWRKYVRYTVRRYRNYVDVWEIWNEPDSDDYLQPSNMNGYYPLLKSASRLIKVYDPNSTILNGGIADIKRLKFIDSLYRRGAKYFDALNVHLYYCETYQQANNLDLFKNEWADLERVIYKGKRNKKVWVTEIGCSTYVAALNQNTQKNYLKKSTNYLLQTGYVENVLLYTLRDRDLDDSYEKYFGLINYNFSNKKVWKWYRKLPKK